MGYQLYVGRPIDEPDEPDAADDVWQLAGVLDAEGFGAVSHGHTVFVRVTRAALENGLPSHLPPHSTVLDVPASLKADRVVEDACRDYRRQGYRIAIDGFSMDAPAAGLAAHADYLKMDGADTAAAGSRARVVRCFGSDRTTLVATGVHTFEGWHAAARDGFMGFQGYFFGRPLLVPGRGKAGSPQRAQLLRLLALLNDSNLSTGQLEEIVKHDPVLCYQILRTVNSAAYAVRAEVTSVQQALLLLGLDVVRRWASLWVVAGLNAEAHAELVIMSAVRARLCETVVTATRGPIAGADAFLLGMCSLLDAILGRPMAEAIADLPLSVGTRAALCGETGSHRDVLDCVVAYERGAWRESEGHAARAGVDPRMLPGAFVEALRWSRGFQAVDAPDPSD